MNESIQERELNYLRHIISEAKRLGVPLEPDQIRPFYDSSLLDDYPVDADKSDLSADQWRDLTVHAFQNFLLKYGNVLSTYLRTPVPSDIETLFEFICSLKYENAIATWIKTDGITILNSALYQASNSSNQDSAAHFVRILDHALLVLANYDTKDSDSQETSLVHSLVQLQDLLSQEASAMAVENIRMLGKTQWAFQVRGRIRAIPGVEVFQSQAFNVGNFASSATWTTVALWHSSGVQIIMEERNIEDGGFIAA